ncbi:MAG: glycosyltransferase family protein [bacterium]|nr:glycosyltransferase family protein [bacterium]
MSRVVTIVQARLGSRRLPGKVLAPVAGRRALDWQLTRMRASRLAGNIVVAIPTGAADDALADHCAALGFACFRGHEEDLLDRHYGAACEYGADVVVKVPSDCPLIDPAVIDRVIGRFLAMPDAFDYLGNLHPATYPDGNDVEVMSMATLETAWREADRPFEREHTTPFIWERPQRFRLGNVAWETGRNFSMSHRFTLDYAEDLTFVRAVFERLAPRDPLFSLQDILTLLERQPHLLELNAAYAGVNWYRHHLDELRTIDASATRFPEESTT